MDKLRVKITAPRLPGPLYAPDIFGTKPDRAKVIDWKIQELRGKAQRSATPGGHHKLLASVHELLCAPLALVVIKRVDTIANRASRKQSATRRGKIFRKND